jgi:glucuronate isomerase
LEHHRRIKEGASEISVLPTFRPDAAMNISETAKFLAYVKKLEASSGISIGSYNNYLDALKSRHDFFASMGCIVSDHGLEKIDAEEFTAEEIKGSFTKLLAGKELEPIEQAKLRSALLFQFAQWDFEKGWVQQFHLGGMRNNNTRMLKMLGPDTGWDSIGDFAQARPLAKFLDSLDRDNKLAKTILYNLDPSYNEIMATMTGNFNDGSFAGKVQWGAAWWFLDQKDGITQQINILSNMGLLSRFVGMITDSRSFLSYPRHEYFRRILCNILGHEMEKGELPNDVEWIGEIVKDVCFRNANNYFNLNE